MENIRDLQCGKMSQEHSPQMAEKTSDVSSKKSAKSQKKKFQFLALRTTNRGGKARSWAMRIQSLDEHLTLNIGECPKEESVST